jgi:hypothetical protein
LGEPEAIISPQLNISPTLANGKPLTRTFGDPIAVKEGWKNLPQLCIGQDIPIQCAGRPFIITFDDPWVFGLGKKQCPADMSPILAATDIYFP